MTTPNSASPLVSIIICTRNRASSLRQTIASIGAIPVPSILPCELVIVDNGSTDETRKIVEDSNVSNMPIRYLWEPATGQSKARNTGLKQSIGQIILFTDDDTRVPPNWIASMCDPIYKERADAVAGGVVIPEHLGRLIPCNRSWFASTEEIDSEEPERMVGANMAFGRHVLKSVPQFDEELGPGRLGFADDTLFSWQLLGNGFRILAQFSVAVEHHFDPVRVTPECLFAVAESLGRTSAYIEYHWRHANYSRLVRSRAVANLWARRVRHFWFGKRSLEFELCQRHESAFRLQFREESKLSRKYPKHGSVKLPPKILGDEQLVGLN